MFSFFPAIFTASLGYESFAGYAPFFAQRWATCSCFHPPFVTRALGDEILIYTSSTIKSYWLIGGTIPQTNNLHLSAWACLKKKHLPNLVVFTFPKDGGRKIKFPSGARPIFKGYVRFRECSCKFTVSGSVTTYNQLVELFTSPTEQL